MDPLTKRINSELKKLSHGSEEYIKFHKRIVNTKLPVLGVRVPDLRKLAKALAKTISPDDIAKLLEESQPSYDFILLCGLLITHTKMSDEQAITLTKQCLPLTDSWAHIDTFVETKARFKTQIWLDFALECLKSKTELTVRYGVVSLMCNFLDEAHINLVFKRLRNVKHDAYYVKMALAWTYATAAVNFFDQTLAELESPKIDPWTRTKAYQKMRESRRFSKEQQGIIKQKRQTL